MWLKIVCWQRWCQLPTNTQLIWSECQVCSESFFNDWLCQIKYTNLIHQIPLLSNHDNAIPSVSLYTRLLYIIYNILMIQWAQKFVKSSHETSSLKLSLKSFIFWKAKFQVIKTWVDWSPSHNVSSLLSNCKKSSYCLVVTINLWFK